MSILSITPDAVAGAGGTLQNLGNALRGAYSAAASPTTAIAAPATDEVSEAIASLLGAHAQEFQAISAKAQVFHDDFVSLMNGGAAQYLNTELTNAQQTLANTVNAPAQTVAAAAAAPATTPTSQAFGFSYGPFTVSGTQSFDSATGTGATNLALSLNAAGRSVPLFSATGSETISPTTGALTANFSGTGPRIWATAMGDFSPTSGTFAGSFAGAGPFFSAGGSVNGVVPTSGTGSPQVTGLTLVVDGLRLPTNAVIPVLNGLLQASPLGA